jgi:hypothetical protein
MYPDVSGETPAGRQTDAMMDLDVRRRSYRVP